ncbi:MAG: 16S rRNA (guanine(527)-N(7))-methyltransferase RsmG [Pseudomonadota bacterium]|nr:16S rRNA (guanine(527)-N(7))-methyltransferase RsmG [Pseudomonadota bacterium]
MDEATARAALTVPRETLDRLEAFVALLREENERQNLVSGASLDQVWERHVLDSAQLVGLAPPNATSWLDLGTGAGFPGLVVACLFRGTVTLVEARKLRVEFLVRAAEVLGVAGRTRIICGKVESLDAPPFGVISARAFAPLDKLLALAERFSTTNTRWILPKGRNAKTELEAAESLWQGDFRLEASVTDADASIIVAEAVRRKVKGRSGR